MGVRISTRIDNPSRFLQHLVFQTVSLGHRGTLLQVKNLVSVSIECHIADFAYAFTGRRKLIKELICRFHGCRITGFTPKIGIHRIGNIHDDDHGHVRLLIELGDLGGGLHGQGDIEHVFQLGALNGLADLHAVRAFFGAAAIYHLLIGGHLRRLRSDRRRGPGRDQLIGFRFLDFVAPIGEIAAVPQGHPRIADAQLRHRPVGNGIAAQGDRIAQMDHLAAVFHKGDSNFHWEGRDCLGAFQPQQHTAAFAVGTPLTDLGFVCRQRALSERRNDPIGERKGIQPPGESFGAGNIHMQQELHALLHGVHAFFIGFRLRAVLIVQPERHAAAVPRHIGFQISSRPFCFRQGQYRKGREGIRMEADVQPPVFAGQAFKVQPFPAVRPAVRRQQFFPRRHGFVQTKGHFRAVLVCVKVNVYQHEFRERAAFFQRQTQGQFFPKGSGFRFLGRIDTGAPFPLLPFAAFRMNHAHCAVQRRIHAIHGTGRRMIQPVLQRQFLRAGQFAAAVRCCQMLPQCGNLMDILHFFIDRRILCRALQICKAFPQGLVGRGHAAGLQGDQPFHQADCFFRGDISAVPCGHHSFQRRGITFFKESFRFSRAFRVGGSFLRIGQAVDQCRQLFQFRQHRFRRYFRGVFRLKGGFRAGALRRIFVGHEGRFR